MRSALMLIAVLLSVAGYFCYGVRRLRAEFLPAVFSAGLSIVLFLGGLLNLLPHTVWAVLLGGCGLLVHALLRRQLPARRDCAVLGLFFALILYFSFLLRGRLLIAFDNFSHWSLVVDVLLGTNHLPNFTDPHLTFQAYPLGSSLVQYFFACLIGSSDSIKLLAQTFMMLAMLFPILCTVRRQIPLLAVPAALYMVFAMSCDMGYSELLVDLLMPLAGFAAFCALYALRGEPETAMCTTSLLCAFCCFIKNSGLFFYAVCLAFVPFYYAASIRKRPVRWLLAALFPAFVVLVWHRHVSYAFLSGETSMHAMSLENYARSFASITPEQVRYIFSAVIRYAMHPVHRLPVMLCCVMQIIFLPMYLRARLPLRRPAAMLLANALIVGGYLLGLAGMYLFSMRTPIGHELASFGRYFSSLSVFLVGINLMVCADNIRQLADNHARLSTLVCLALCALLALPVYTYRGNLPLLFTKPDQRETEHARLLAAGEGLGMGSGCRYMLYSGDPDSWYYTYALIYTEFFSDVDHIDTLDEETLRALPGAYDFLILDCKADEAEEALRKLGRPYGESNGFTLVYLNQ